SMQHYSLKDVIETYINSVESALFPVQFLLQFTPEFNEKPVPHMMAFEINSTPNKLLFYTNYCSEKDQIAECRIYEMLKSDFQEFIDNIKQGYKYFDCFLITRE
ncbi:MAG: hypothetical protein VW397_00965, partial [Candidatus Margulisiibacteriota bacterium]